MAGKHCDYPKPRGGGEGRLPRQQSRRPQAWWMEYPAGRPAAPGAPHPIHLPSTQQPPDLSKTQAPSCQCSHCGDRVCILTPLWLTRQARWGPSDLTSLIPHPAPHRVQCPTSVPYTHCSLQLQRAALSTPTLVWLGPTGSHHRRHCLPKPFPALPWLSILKHSSLRRQRCLPVFLSSSSPDCQRREGRHCGPLPVRTPLPGARCLAGALWACSDPYKGAQ